MPREGHKFSSWSIRSLSTHFNPHAPWWARQRDVDFGVIPKTFQSTCPARGTTTKRPYPRLADAWISIHVPREGHDSDVGIFNQSTELFQSTCPARGTTGAARGAGAARRISIHVPREGHDMCSFILSVFAVPTFQSTCPARGTTNQDDNHGTYRKISIHVPREGHDIIKTTTTALTTRFQSTCPARGTTVRQ